MWSVNLLWKYFYIANSHRLNSIRRTVFILEDCFSFYKNYSKTHRDVADMRKGSGSCSLFVQQLDHKSEFLGTSSKGLHKPGGKSMDADTLQWSQWKSWAHLPWKPWTITVEVGSQINARDTAEVHCSLQSYISSAGTCCYFLSILSNLISPNSVHHVLKGA